MKRLLRPRIVAGSAAALEVRSISRYHGKPVGNRRCRDQAVDHRQGTPLAFRCTDELTPPFGDVAIQRQQPRLETRGEVGANPLAQTGFASGIHKLGNALFQFPKGQHAEEEPILVLCVHPLDHPWIRDASDKFRHHRCIEQIAHRSTGRPVSVRRTMSSSTPTRGDRRKNSVNEPFRFDSLRY